MSDQVFKIIMHTGTLLCPQGDGASAQLLPHFDACESVVCIGEEAGVGQLASGGSSNESVLTMGAGTW